MRHEPSDIGHNSEIRKTHGNVNNAFTEDFVLEKSIFNNIFEKDIRRVYIYKKAERLAKAIHLIAPAFAESESLRHRIDAIAIGLVDAALLSAGTVRTKLSREILTLSSILSMARTGSLLSPMNVDLILHEARLLLQEVASYEEPRLLFDETPSLSDIARRTVKKEITQNHSVSRIVVAKAPALTKGHIKDTSDTPHVKDRRDAIMSVIRNKNKASIKDISTLIRNVSEKTIQRELISLIGSGEVVKEGERRWSTYSLA